MGEIASLFASLADEDGLLTPEAFAIGFSSILDEQPLTFRCVAPFNTSSFATDYCCYSLFFLPAVVTVCMCGRVGGYGLMNEVIDVSGLQ